MLMSILDTIKKSLSGTALSSIISKDGSVLGIDIGSASIKVVQLKREGGKAVLETYGAMTLGPYANTDSGRVVKLSPPKLAEAITNLLREASVSTNNAAVAIPFASSLTSIIEMPNVSKDQLNTMVPLEARKYIPVSTSDVTIDWFVIPENKEQEKGDKIKDVYSKSTTSKTQNMLSVFLVAIHNSTLNDYQSIMASAQLNTSFYELEVFSAARSSLGHSTRPIVVVDMGASNTKVYVIENGMVRMSHMINKGSQDLSLYIQRSLNLTFKQAEQLKNEKGLSQDSEITLKDGSKALIRDAMLSTLDHIFAGINRVLLNYGKKYNKNVAKVVFCGGSTAMDGFYEYADSKIDNIVELSDPFNKVQTPAFLDSILKEVGPEFAVATGVALRQLYDSN
ncbi:MAG: type IV pilus assembly protein PilM [Candidatus Pacebacteria bacterium]|nr:type IV pilus assembly protein PilM [Candidatus Paceibacterota bacterium]